MKISELLNVVGALELKKFAWGPALVEVLNEQLKTHVADPTQLLTPENTGVQASAALFALPPDEMAAFIVRTFDTGSRVLHATPAAPAAVVSPPPKVPFPAPPAPAPAKPAPKLTDPVAMIASLPQKAKNNLALIMGGTLVAVTLLLAVAMSVTTVKKGEMPDSKALDTVTQILGEVVKAYMKSPEAPSPAH